MEHSMEGKSILRLDPRTKLFMVLVVSTIVMMSATTTFMWVLRTLITFIPVLLLVLEGRIVSALRFGALYLIALIIARNVLSSASTGVVTSLLLGYCAIVVQFMPAMITAWYMIRTTKIGEFLSAMQKMHVPDGIAISLAVVMRFFPTVKEEYGAIKDAMKMRGIVMGSGHVTKMVEYRMIPLLFSCVSIGDELSAAAITRGLGADIKRSSVVELRLKAIDIIIMIGLMIMAFMFIISKYTQIL